MTELQNPQLSDYKIIVTDQENVIPDPELPSRGRKRYKGSAERKPDAPERKDMVYGIFGYGQGDTIEEAVARTRRSLEDSIARSVARFESWKSIVEAPVVAEVDA